MGVRPAQAQPYAQPPVVNPHIERNTPPPPSSPVPANIPSNVPVYAMDYDETASTLHAQEAVAKDYAAQEQRAKANKVANVAKVGLDEHQKRHGPKADAMAKLASKPPGNPSNGHWVEVNTITYRVTKPIRCRRVWSSF